MMVAKIIATLPTAPTGPCTGKSDPGCWFGGAAATMLSVTATARIVHATRTAGRASNGARKTSEA